MSDMVCPHCHGTVPRGATVCRGCQAEIEYGAPPITFLLTVLAALYLGYLFAGMLPDGVAFLGWFAALGALIGAWVLIAKTFKDRVNFKRIYRTK